ncbi:islet amyloid polypeptide isoform X1 [Phascolarctos cinereus]|uniref:Islet amyloid polypeptide n=1 Tax=Phascolarctos cinereus TaxID=38626 RepID=A0A6P5L2L5_PHACI|nr:islet amyloid polypeptide isoform X1 [Phascolarctos cinereus]
MGAVTNSPSTTLIKFLTFSQRLENRSLTIITLKEEAMCNLKLPVVLIVFSVALSYLEATPIDRLMSVAGDLSYRTSDRQEWILPILSRNTLLELSGMVPEQEAGKTKSHHLEKRKCNTATCVTQRLADFLVRSNNNIGAIFSPTNVGSNTYGKRDTVGMLSRKPLNYLPH